MEVLLTLAPDRAIDNVLGTNILAAFEVASIRHRLVVVDIYGVAVLQASSGLLTVCLCHTDLSAGRTGGAGFVVVGCGHDELDYGV